MRSAGAASCLYFIFWIFLGNFILLNLFLAILLDNFSSKDSGDDEESDEEDDFNHEYMESVPSPIRRSSLLMNLTEAKRARRHQDLMRAIDGVHDSSDNTSHLE